jgi:hypothetical protein
MMLRPEYALKMAEKRELARRAGITLHMIEPEDMLMLDKIFGYLILAEPRIGGHKGGLRSYADQSCFVMLTYAR